MIIEKQIQREAYAVEQAYQKLMTQEREACLFNNGSNSLWSMTLKKDIVQAMIKILQEEIDIAKDPKNKNTDRIPVRASQATQALEDCLGINIVCRKGDDGVYRKHISNKRKNYFKLPTAAFLCAQIALDNCLSPKIRHTVPSKKSNSNKKTGVQHTYIQLAQKIGECVEQEVRFQQISTNFPKFWEVQDRRASGRDGADDLLSSTRYWQQQMKDAISNRAAWTAQQQDVDPEIQRAEIDALTWKPWTRKQCVHIGSWLLRAFLIVTGKENLNIFETQYEQRGGKSGEYIYLTKQGAVLREQFLTDLDQFCYEPLPMLVPPVDNSKRKMKGWLNPSFWSRPPGFEGVFHMGDQHLTFLNNLQKVAYRTNPFIVQLMEKLTETNQHLGKFVPEYYKEPATVADRLGYGSIEDHELQTKLVVNHPDFKKVKRQRSNDITRMKRRVLDGQGSRALLRLVQYCKGDEQFWIPVSWDFRGRVYYRVPYLNPQGTDPAKAVLQFARPTKVDQYTCYFLRLAISAAAGQDKKSYEDRLDWVVRHHDEIKNIALMFTDEGDYTSAISFLESIDDPWDFAAACEEYYWCCLAPKAMRRKVTHYRCALDATAQGAQIVSGLRRSRAGASKVNVLKTDCPNDVYVAVWKALIDEAAHKGMLRPKILKYMKESGKGRKLAKSGIYMSAQYGSGVEKQYEEFCAIHKDLPKHNQFNDKELELLKSCFRQAVEKSLSISTFVDWMRCRAKEAFDNGRKHFNIPTANGNHCLMRYSKREVQHILTFHHGSLNIDPLYKQFNDLKDTKEPDLSDWIKACAANAIHAQDASLLSQAYFNWDYNLSTVHDSIVSAPGACMIALRRRFIQAFVDTIKWDFWSEIYKANHLQLDDEVHNCVIGDLDPDEVLQANYLVC